MSGLPLPTLHQLSFIFSLPLFQPFLSFMCWFFFLCFFGFLMMTLGVDGRGGVGDLVEEGNGVGRGGVHLEGVKFSDTIRRPHSIATLGSEESAACAGPAPPPGPAPSRGHSYRAYSCRTAHSDSAGLSPPGYPPEGNLLSSQTSLLSEVLVPEYWEIRASFFISGESWIGNKECKIVVCFFLYCCLPLLIGCYNKMYTNSILATCMHSETLSII